MPSTSETAVLQEIGHDIIHSFVAVTVETFFIGTRGSEHTIAKDLKVVFSDLLCARNQDESAAVSILHDHS